MKQNFSAALTVDEVGKVAPPEPLSAGKKAVSPRHLPEKQRLMCVLTVAGSTTSELVKAVTSLLPTFFLLYERETASFAAKQLADAAETDPRLVIPV